MAPPNSAPRSVSVAGVGTKEKRSRNSELASIPNSDPKKNRLPSTLKPARNSGTFRSAVKRPTVPTPVISTISMARPLTPPTLIECGSMNRSKPSAKIAQPSVIRA